MSTTDFVVTLTDKAVRVHRATCKRQGNALPMAEVPLDHLALARPASCCKPSAQGIQEALAEVATARKPKPVAGKPARQRATAKPGAAKPVKLPKVDVDGDGNGILTIAFSTLDVAKHYWAVFCRDAAKAIGAAHGVQVDANMREALITGPSADVEAVRSALATLWSDGYEAFNTWRASDEDYLAVKAASSGVSWGRSAKKPAEFAWMAAAVQDAASASR